MGRWLSELKKLENAPEATPQNSQNPLEDDPEGEKTQESALDGTPKTPKTPVRHREDAAEPKPYSGSEEGSALNVPEVSQRTTHSAPAPIDAGNVIRGPWERQPGDMDAYAAALRMHGPMSYGMAMGVLGWGGTRAGQAEQDLLAAGRIRFNAAGRAVLVEEVRHDDHH